MNTLAGTEEGKTVEIKDFLGELNKDFIYDIMDHGVVPGVKVTIVRNLKGNDKIIFSVGSTNLSIRKKDAECIIILEI